MNLNSTKMCMCLSISIKFVGGDVVVVVRDDGRGMNANKKKMGFVVRTTNTIVAVVVCKKIGINLNLNWFEAIENNGLKFSLRN